MENEVKEPAFRYNYVTPAEYLVAERAAEEKHEYYDGQVLAMGGARLNHIEINRDLLINIHPYLKGKKCFVLSSNMRVSTPARDAYMYPDTLIVCDEPELEDEISDTLLNPSVIFEILPLSIRGIDKGRKFFFYQRIPSLQEYIMIDSSKRFTHIARKQADGAWRFENISDPTGSLFIRTINFTLPLRHIYRDTGL